jgi:hypothetical protein
MGAGRSAVAAGARVGGSADARSGGGRATSHAWRQQSATLPASNGREQDSRRRLSRSIVPCMAQLSEHRRPAASSLSRPRGPGAQADGGSGSRRGFHVRGLFARRWSECRKSLLTPRFDRHWRLTRGGECVQEEGEYEYASDNHKAENGNEPHSLGSGVLYQPLDGESTSESAAGSTVPLCEAVAGGPCARLVPDDKSPDVESKCNKTGQSCSGGSRCRQYGGHWEGHECVAIRRPTGSHDICRTATAVTTASGVFSGPPGWFAIVVGQLVCFIPGS